MSLASVSIRRPIFITCVAFLLAMLGMLSLGRLPVDLFPNITFPIVMVSIPYPGAGPQEIETLVSRPVEDELVTVPGMKSLRSMSLEGMSRIIAEFTLETDIKYAEQQVRDRVSQIRRNLPEDILDPAIRRVDPADQPIVILALTGNMKESELYEIADRTVRPKLEQIKEVGLVEVTGGRKREIQVELDLKKLKDHEISASSVAARIAAGGKNIPAGKVEEKNLQTVIRTLAEYRNLKDIENTIVNFAGNDVPVTVKDLGRVVDGLEDEKSRTFTNGTQSTFLFVFKQSGANTVRVSDSIKTALVKLNADFKNKNIKVDLQTVRDGAFVIRANVEDVKESILIGVCLTLIVVLLFLGSLRSTLITGIAIPNSLIGAFFLMFFAGFTINVMSLLALSLAVGLLVDDAIVVRENIFRHMEMGKPPLRAAEEGTKEVLLAVLATTLTVVAVFGPIGFLQGVVGQFFKEFGLTVCFAMAISLFDALTMAPMLSAYFGGVASHGKVQAKGIWNSTGGALLRLFDKFQTFLEKIYVRTLGRSLKYPILILVGALGLFIFSLWLAKRIPSTFLPPQDNGEFSVNLELPAGSTLNVTAALSKEVDGVLAKIPQISSRVQTIGDRDGSANTITFFVNLVPSKQRNLNTSQVKDVVREKLKPYAHAKPSVRDIDMVMGGQRPFNLNIVGSNLEELEKISKDVFEKIKNHPALKDPDLNLKPGKPEFQVVLDENRSKRLGVSTLQVGMELRTLLEGNVPAVFRDQGQEYDIRVRLSPEQRNLKANFNQIFVPNVNQSLVRLDKIAKTKEAVGLSSINRLDRARYFQIASDFAANGPGLQKIMADIKEIFDKEIKLPPGFSYRFVGQAENFVEMQQNMMMAAGLGILFIYLVLASLYESFVIPFTIMLVLPLAASGAFIALYVSGRSLDIFSMIGCIMLLGIATKNSILLVDYTNLLVSQGVNRMEALLKAGEVRLRPILMTSIALIAGMLPVAIGLNEASKQRTSMGVAIIGGLISSTLLTLFVVPAAFSYLDRFRVWTGSFFRKNNPVIEDKEMGLAET